MHYTLIVIGNGDLEEMMEPFYQDKVVEEYCMGDVPEMDKQRFLEYYNEHTPGYHFSMEQFDELYKAKGEDWNRNQWRKDSDGIWRQYSTSNPNMRWDWYEVGGRWPGRLQLKEGAEAISGLNFSWGWEAHQRDKFQREHPDRCDIARKGDIANLDTLTSWAVLKDGEWYEPEGLDDSGMSVAPFLSDVDDDTIITCIDYHM